MDDASLKLALIDWLQTRAKIYPETKEAGKLSGLFSMEARRHEILCHENANYIYLSWITSDLLEPLHAKICRIGDPNLGGDIEATFAVYAPDDFLWLDDHARDDGFQGFVRRERIVPKDAATLAQFLLETKFQFLLLGNQGLIVSKKSDIPWFPDRMIDGKTQKDKDENKRFYDNLWREMDTVIAQIYPPRLIQEDAATRLEFCIWGRTMGIVSEIHCWFAEHEPNFWWHGKRLAVSVGYNFIPR